MKSKAHIKSHPLHPILIPFPIAFFTGTLVFHILGWAQESTDLLTVAYYCNLAGIIGAVLAAIPGIIDYINTVPPDSSAKKRGAQHGLANTTMLILFTIAFFVRRQDDPEQYTLLALEVVGAGLMFFAGWMGGTLVYRNQIGVDVRYAHSAKWNEAHINGKDGHVEVAASGELKVNAMKLLYVNGKRIVLARTEDQYVAFDDRCPHKGGSLAGGSMMCGTVQCPWHGSQFKVHTGALTAGPSKEGIQTYPVEEREGKVYLKL
jgi:nitrite reductase/ring-hydroxylating ferredoxin subunit/uncharacterized membrane protein